MRRFAVVLAALLFVGGCEPTETFSEPTQAVVVLVSDDENFVFQDFQTIVETADGSRYSRAGEWGAVGDTLHVIIGTHEPTRRKWWTSP